MIKDGASQSDVAALQRRIDVALAGWRNEAGESPEFYRRVLTLGFLQRTAGSPDSRPLLEAASWLQPSHWDGPAV